MIIQILSFCLYIISILCVHLETEWDKLAVELVEQLREGSNMIHRNMIVTEGDAADRPHSIKGDNWDSRSHQDLGDISLIFRRIHLFNCFVSLLTYCMNKLRAKKWLSFSNLDVSWDLGKSPVSGVQRDNRLLEGNLRKSRKVKSWVWK